MKFSATVLIALTLAGSALAAPSHTATLTIQHAPQGCHTWAFDGKTGHASQTVVLAHSAQLVVVDNDVMPHMLIQVSGPKAAVTGAAMGHMGAVSRVRFRSAGTYVFTTRAGEDYPSMMGPSLKTAGEDNVLRLTVRIS